MLLISVGYTLHMKERELERICKALANRRRLMILGLLKRRKKLSVGDVADGIRLSIRSTSKHLLMLSGAGIVDREQRNLTMLYSLAPDMPSVAKTAIASL